MFVDYTKGTTMYTIGKFCESFIGKITGFSEKIFFHWFSSSIFSVSGHERTIAKDEFCILDLLVGNKLF